MTKLSPSIDPLYDKMVCTSALAGAPVRTQGGQPPAYTRTPSRTYRFRGQLWLSFCGVYAPDYMWV